MKKFLSLLLAALMLCSALTACGDSGTTAPGSEAESSGEPASNGTTGSGVELKFSTGGEQGTYYGFGTVLAVLEEKGYSFVSAKVEMVPQNYVKLESEEDIKNMEKLIDLLEENEDVQNVYHNWEQE